MFSRQLKCRSNVPVLNTKTCLSGQSHTEASDEYEVPIEELSFEMILEMVLAVPRLLTHLVITSGNKAGVSENLVSPEL